MIPSSKKAGKFYCTFKIHKSHAQGSVPPERPIISCSGAFLENVGIFIEFYIKHKGTVHHSYLKDTPDFLRHIKVINENFSLPKHTMIVTMDVKALYTNIPQKEGVECVQEAFENNDNTSDIPCNFLIQLLNILLKHNIFEFNKKLYRQKIGAAMGSRPIPSYANIFMANRIDKHILHIFKKFQTSEGMKLILFKRFLDDLFFIICGKSKDLHTIFDEINMIHPAIKLTMNHTTIDNEKDPCSCDILSEIPYLDVNLSLKEGKIVTDLYKKPTDRNQYLLPSSCHADHTVKSIPFSLALRIVRICSEPELRNKRLKELKQMLYDREYSPAIVEPAIKRAMSIPRTVALKESTKKIKSNERPVFAITYDPRLPDITKILNKHWRAGTQMDSYFQEVFPAPPLAGFRKQRNLQNFLIRAKVESEKGRHIQRSLRGMKRCTKFCSICPYIKEGKVIRSSKFTWHIRSNVNCNTSNIIYMIQCNKDKCSQRYIGQSKRSLRQRISEHKGYITSNNQSQPTGEHFSKPGHNISNMTVTIIEKVKQNSELFRKEREHYFINKFNTYYSGINKQL